MSIAYFAHELGDPAVRKRVRMIEAGGRKVELLGFERRRFASDGHGPEPHVLGRTRNGKLLARVFAVLGAIPRAWRIRSVWDKSDALLARNLEMLTVVSLLKWLTRSNAPVVYECLDIHRLMLGQGPASKALRALERACMRGASLVLTSSPAFEARYFRAVQGYRGKILLLENKVLSLSEPLPALRTPSAGPPWKIAWCGVLRCRRSLEILRQLAQTQGDRVQIELWGAPALDQIPDFHEIVGSSAQMRFMGSYRPEDLATIYGDAHFVWAIDYYEQGGNSDWLLPNRLYEGLYFGATPIAAAGVETARWLEARQLGVVLEEPAPEKLSAFIANCTAERYAALRAAVAHIDPQAVTFTLQSCRALVDEMASGAAA